MRASITVCIGTFGDRAHWEPLAQRAMASVLDQTLRPEAMVWRHGKNLQDARNGAAVGAMTDWLCFLDADDELDSRYIEAMDAATRELTKAALLQPATLGVYPDGSCDATAVLIPPKPLLTGNFMVIGTLIRRDQFERLGGFDDWPIYEDWDLWIRAWDDGADLLAVPAAIYRVHVNEAGRNNGARALQQETYREIRLKHMRKRSRRG